MSGEERLPHVRDFASNASRAESGQRDLHGHGETMAHQYSSEGNEGDAYDMSLLPRESPARSNAGSPEGGYQLPPGAAAEPAPAAFQGSAAFEAYTPSRPAPTPDAASSAQHHYPPSTSPSNLPSSVSPSSTLGKHAPTPMRLDSDFTTVPLKDPYNQPPLKDYGNGLGASGVQAHGRPRSKLGFAQLSGTKMAATPGASVSSFDSQTPEKNTNPRRNASWDALNEWEDYNPAQAKDERLRFAEGDAGTNKFSKLYLWAINKGIIVRWILYIVPILALLWIPGIVGVTAAPDARVWRVKLLFWSIWLSVLWLGFWGAKAAFMLFPWFYRQTICVVAPNMKQYVDVVKNLGRYAAFILWSLVVAIAFQPLIARRYEPGPNYDANDPPASKDVINRLSKLFPIFVVCFVILGLEKLAIQLIAFQFHRDTYADRLAEQKTSVKMLTRLYINSHDVPGRNDTLKDNASATTSKAQISRMAIRKALKGVKNVVQSTTTAFGNVASEMAGSSVLQTNSPHNKVTAALSSANKSKALGRRLYYSFRQPGVDHITIADIARFFPDLETAEVAFTVFDRDGNGDATRDEIDESMMEIHRERMSLEASMRDLDGAVRRLDEILLAIVFAICAYLIATVFTSTIAAWTASAGTALLSISWMIGTTMQEILLACIFLFVKHPFDVGDRVDIDGNSYTVAKMELLSTSFKRVDGKFVWIGHNILATKVIENVRRSGPTSETFVFEVAFDTTFEKLQALRVMMLKFCKENKRDFQPTFDVIVDDIPAQGKMVLKADIKYKSNWQQGALKVQRRNKWICQIKMILADLQIYGPADAGNPSPIPPDPTRVSLIPYETLMEQEANAPERNQSPPPTFSSATGGNLVQRRPDSSLDLWGEYTDLETAPPSRMPSPGPDSSLRMRTPPRRDQSLPMSSQQIQQLHGQEGSFRPGGGYSRV